MPHKKISTTAYTIVDSLSKLSKSQRFGKLIPKQMYYLNQIFATHAKDSFVKTLINILPLSVSTGIMDIFYIPGMTYHYLFRKLLIEKKLRNALQTGTTQIIVLGAGLDTLALRIAKDEATAVFFEIDLPYTQQAKLQILNEASHAIPNNCIFKTLDLATTNLAAVLLSDSHFNPKAATMVILEGVLMYLTESEVRTLFTDLHALITGDFTVIFGAISTPDTDKNHGVQITNFFLRKGNEGTKWFCSGEDMPHFMDSLGYELQEWMPYKKLQSVYRSQKEINHICDDENYYVVSNKREDRKIASTPLSIEKIPFISL